MAGINGDPLETIEATPADVAVLLRARTKDADGNELGAWTEATRPTFEQVQEQIDIARSLTAPGASVPDACKETAEATVALLAAMLVEQSYFPEQINESRSAYDRLAALYTDAKLSLADCIEAHTATGGVFDVDVSGAARHCPLPPDWWQRNLEHAR